MPYRGEVLVAIIKNKADFTLAMDKHWYRVPVSSQEKWLKDRWPPKWLAFYQTKKLGLEAYAIHYFAKVNDIQQAYGWQLFNQSRGAEKDNNRYHQIFLEPLQELPKPIVSHRYRARIVFIPTTWVKFIQAREINELYSESSLEDKLWDALK